MKNSTIEGFFIELNLRKKKWLSCCTYNPNHSFMSDHLSTIGNNIDLQLENYENFLLMGDLNVEGHNGFLKKFCDLYNLKNLIKVPTCFKNSDFPTSIDVMLTASYRNFHNSCAIEMRLSDFHKIFNFSAEEYRQNILSLLSS